MNVLRVSLFLNNNTDTAESIHIYFEWLPRTSHPTGIKHFSCRFLKHTQDMIYCAIYRHQQGICSMVRTSIWNRSAPVWPGITRSTSVNNPPADRIRYSDAEREARREKLDYGMIRIQCHPGITGRRNGIRGRVWSRSSANRRRGNEIHTRT